MEKLIKLMEQMEKLDLVPTRQILNINYKFDKKSKEWILSIYENEYIGETFEEAKNKAIDDIKRQLRMLEALDQYFEDMGGVA